MFRPVRTQLLDELETLGSARPKILSIVAPTGYGKTVLMSEYCAYLGRSGQRCYWVSLDDRHKSAERVLHAISVALFGQEAAVHPTQALFRGDESLESRVDELIEYIARLPASTTVFIDNLNSCSDESLGALLDALIFRTPSSVRFVWSSTTLLGINLGRAKLEALIRQVAFAELSLNASETRELLGADVGGHLGVSGVAALLRQTEGWPAAIRMAQIILAGSDRPQAALDAFSGSNQDVAALLNRQVVQGFSAALRDFLLAVAQLRTFGVDLCRHASGSSDADAHLDYLLQRNVFIIPLDQNRSRYRLHGFFREFLLSEAERTVSPETTREVLRRAALWCEQNGEWQDAIDYALAAGEASLAGRMLDRAAKLFVRERGDIQQYVHWVERLRAGGFDVGWETHYWYVWALIFQRHFEYGRQQLEGLTARFSARSDRDEPPADLLQRINHLRVCIDLFTDRLSDASCGADLWLQEKTSNDPYSVGSMLCIQSICLASEFKFGQARKLMRSAQPILLEIGGADIVGWISLIDGTRSIYEGDYAHAYRELLAGLSRAREKLGEEASLCGTMAFVAAKCAVEMDQKDEARNLIALGLRTAQDTPQVEFAAFGLDAAVKLWKGGADDFVSVPRLREIAKGYPPRLSLLLCCYLVQRLLCLGRVSEALVEAESIGMSAEPGKIALPKIDEFSVPRYRDLYMATAICLLIATRQFKQAEALVAHELRLAKEDGRYARLVELGLANMAIAMHGNNPGQATKELSLAVSRAARRRIVRPFHDRADMLANLVNDTKPSSWSFALAEEREFFAEICRGLPVDGPLANSPAIWGEDQGLRVSLTKREAKLLTLLDMGWSNQQIADYSNLSITTIKWHHKNLYRKFGVSTRYAALARARALKLIGSN